ncbi:MAG: hypothetical protein QHH14_02795 [Clostridiales bacterium]|nr:hypothetical protein [Clostridiales bacterium]
MSREEKNEVKASFAEIIIEALKGIKSEILLYAVAVAALFVVSASLGLDVLNEVKWPLILIFTIALIAYFFARAVPRAQRRLKKRKESL